MSHPLIIEALETEFVPLFICNNNRKPGNKDRAILKKYKEPAWNYQVMRFFDSTGKDLIPRADRKKLAGIGGTANQICLALKAAKKPAPRYLQDLVAAYVTIYPKTRPYRLPKPTPIFVSVDDYAKGEMTFGALTPVTNLEAGTIGGTKVLRLWYNPSTTSLGQVIAAADAVGTGNALFLPSDQMKVAKVTSLKLQDLMKEPYKAADASIQRSSIRETVVMTLGLTPYQLTKVNAFYTVDKKKALGHLSPRQLKAYGEALKKAE